VELRSSVEMLETNPPDKVVSMPEGSWGEEGDHRVWTNDKVNWMWDIEYRCEANFGKATMDLPWRTNPQIEDLLKKAGRELFLLQASDWQFIITRGQAIDYGIKRFMQHVSRFETLLALSEKLAQDTTYLGKLNEIEKFEVEDAAIHDIIFNEIELDWWKM
jgi:1,4-alpha-glucan branching enzyme